MLEDGPARRLPLLGTRLRLAALGPAAPPQEWVACEMAPGEVRGPGRNPSVRSGVLGAETEQPSAATCRAWALGQPPGLSVLCRIGVRSACHFLPLRSDTSPPLGQRPGQVTDFGDLAWCSPGCWEEGGGRRQEPWAQAQLRPHLALPWAYLGTAAPGVQPSPAPGPVSHLTWPESVKRDVSLPPRTWLRAARPRAHPDTSFHALRKAVSGPGVGAQPTAP